MEIDYDPIATMPSIKFVEGCEDDAANNNDDTSIKVISCCDSDEVGYR